VNDDVRKLEFALNELVTHQVLVMFTKDEKRAERRKIIDIEYVLTPHPKFVQEVKAANKRQQLSASAST
jgi:hypothetical protein